MNDIIYCFAASAFVSFNRYMVECEYVKYGSRAYRYLVLIDTWWNVNIKFVTAPAAAESRFNRYMVECELYEYSFRNRARSGF